MPKLKKLLLITLAALIAIIVLAMVAVSRIDGAAIYATLSDEVNQRSAWQLAPEGELSLSFFPLGVVVSNLTARQDQQTIAVDKLVLELAWWPLLTGDIQIDTLTAQAPRVLLYANASTQAAESEAEPQAEPQAEPSDNQAEADQQNIAISLQNLSIRDGEFALFNDAGTRQWHISALNIDINAWRDGLAAPAQLSFHLAGETLPLALAAQISTRIKTELASQSVSIESLSATLNALDDPPSAPGATQIASLLPLNIDGAAQWQGQGKTLHVPSFNITADAFSLRSGMNASLGESVSAQLKAAFKAANSETLMQAFGIDQQLPLGQIALDLDADWQNEAAEVTVSKLRVSNSNWHGKLFAAPQEDRYTLTLNGDRLDLRPWLALGNAAQPTTATSSSSDAASANTASQNTAPAPETKQEQPPIPATNLTLDLTLSSLILDRETINDLRLQLRNDAQTLRLAPFSLRIGDGEVALNGSLRHGQSPWQHEWALQVSALSLTSLNSLAREEPSPVLGTAASTLTFTAQGHTPEAIIASLQGGGDITINEGAVEGINLHQLACFTYAQLNRETLAAREWTTRTDFANATTTLALAKGGHLRLEALRMNSATLRAEGSAKADLEPATLNAKLQLYAEGAHEDSACRVHPKVARLPIPAKCEGTWSPADIACSVDSSKLRDALKDLAKDEAKRKAEKELDRAIDKKLGGSEETREAVKSLLKGIFK